MRTRTVALGVLAVVLLAIIFGAPGLFGGDGPETNTTGTPTATPLPQAPGVGAETLENVTALVRAHRGSMSNVGFVAQARLNDDTVTYSYATDGSRLVEREDGSGTIWGDGDVAYERTTEDGTVSYERLPGGAVELDTLLQYSQIRERLSSGRFERDGTTPCGDTTCVVLTANRSIGGNYRNFTGELHVDSTGVVHMLEVEWVRTSDDRAFEYRFTVEELRKLTLERPDWVDEAENSTA
jgi:hypothetical protein